MSSANVSRVHTALRLGLVLGLPLVVQGGCGPAPAPPKLPPWVAESWAEVQCERLIECNCGPLPGGSLDACESLQAQRFAQVAEAYVPDGTFDESCFHGWEEAALVGGCDPLQEFVSAYYDVLEEQGALYCLFVNGDGQQGDSCTWQLEAFGMSDCAAGSRCTKEGCQPFGESSGLGVIDLPSGDLGDPCVTDAESFACNGHDQSDRYCHPVSWTCVEVVAEGMPCAPGDLCGSGAYCEGWSPEQQGTCVPKAALGQTCNALVRDACLGGWEESFCFGSVPTCQPDVPWACFTANEGRRVESVFIMEERAALNEN